jgi:uncharacterized surface protein with fasciclin (FAS1) repeats
MITKKKNKLTSLLTRALSVTLISATLFTAINCDDDDDNTPAQQTVLEIAVANPDFDVLAAAATKAGEPILSVLRGNTQITVFAPTDEAFATHFGVATEALALAEVNDLTPAEAIDLLTFHVIAGSEIEAEDIAAGTAAVTTAREGANNKAFVTKTGSYVTINNARVVTADVDASNGVIHIIDAVLTPPVGNVVEVATSAANAPNFGILAAALTKAELITTLQGNGPFTVFAPTDDAFLALLRSAAFFNNPDLTEEDVTDYISTSNASSTPLSLTTLTQVLLYHVVPAAGYSINLTNNQVLTTAKAEAPKTVTIGVGSAVTVDGSASDPSTVTAANISATNGVIHVIDKVLLP